MNKYDRLVGGTLTSIASTPQEQLHFLNQFGAFYFWLNTLGALLLSLLFWLNEITFNIGIAVWLMGITILALGCWTIQSQFKIAKLKKEKLTRYRLINLMLCATWGISGIFLFSEDPVIQTIHLCLLLVIALSVWPMSIVSTAEFCTQLALLLAPISIMLTLQQNLETNLLCFVIIAFVGTAIVMSHFFTLILKHLLEKEQLIIEKITVDPVTELMGSRHFEKMLKREWCRCARNQQPLSLIIIEIDNFRAIEDELEVKTTQKHLKTVTNCLKSVARRSSDTLGYHGSDGFAALLPGTKLEDAKKVAERLQQKIAREAMPNPLAENQIITVSVGISSCVPINSINNKRDHDVLKSISYPAGLIEEAEQMLNNARQETDTILTVEPSPQNNLEQTALA